MVLYIGDIYREKDGKVMGKRSFVEDDNVRIIEQTLSNALNIWVTYDYQCDYEDYPYIDVVGKPPPIVHFTIGGEKY